MNVGRTGAFPAAFFFSVLVWGAESWERKRFEQWNEEDCLQVLERSPWVQLYSFARAVGVAAVPEGMGSNAEEGGSGQDQTYPAAPAELSGSNRDALNVLRIRLASAKPIRMALGRLRILDGPGDSDLFHQVIEYVEAPPPEHIVVEVTWFSRPESHESVRDIEDFFRQMTLPLLSEVTHLAGREPNIRLPLIRFTPPGEGSPAALFYFPRYDETGRPHFSGDEREIIFYTEIDLTRIGEASRCLVTVRLDPKRLFYRSRLEM